jgi:hypothetical protein
MVDNWELAVSHASGEYITVVGDDDGLLFHALSVTDLLITQSKAKAVRFGKIGYCWPEAVFATANQIAIPLDGSNGMLESTDMIRKVINYQVPYYWLPMIYNSFIHRELVDLLRQQTGKVFQSHVPDIYSGFAFAYLSQSYLSVGRPLGISGRGGKSTSYALISMDNKVETQGINNYGSLWDDSEIDSHPLVPNYSKLKTATVDGPQVAEPFLQAKDRLFPNDAKLSLNRKWIIYLTMRTLKADTEEHWQEMIDVVRNSLSDSKKLQSWFDSKFLNQPPRIVPSHPENRLPFPEFNGSCIILNAADFGVKDVFGAAELGDNFYPDSRDTIDPASWSTGNPFSWRNRIKKLLNYWLWNDQIPFNKKMRKSVMTFLFGDGF